MPCARCGATSASGAAFCGACGARLEMPAASAAVTFAPPVSAHASAAAPTLVPVHATRRDPRTMATGARVAIAIAGLPVCLIAGFILAQTAESLTNSSDGSYLANGAFTGLLLAAGIATALGFTVRASLARLDVPGQTWGALGAGALGGLLVAMSLVSIAKGIAVAPVIDGRASGADDLIGPAALMALVSGVALIVTMSMGGRVPSAAWMGAIAVLAAFATAYLLFDGWLLLNAGELQRLAAARSHTHRAPLGWFAVPAALAAAAAIAQRRRAKS